MGALTARDAERALRFVGHAAELAGDEPFTPEILRELGDLVASDWTAYMECESAAGGCLAAQEHPDFEEIIGRFDFDWSVVPDADSPLARYSPGRFDAMSLSELLPRRALRNTRYHRLVLQPLGIADMLEIRIPSADSRSRTFRFDRFRGEFRLRDRVVLDFLQPHLFWLWRAAQTRRKLRTALASLEWASEQDGRGVILLSPAGRVELASPAARRIMRDYFEARDGSALPAELAEWLEADARTLVRRHGARRLTVSRSADALLLEESRREPQLTAREREILTWVARGKTNPEIAGILWIAPTTVRRHLEHAFAKLGVRTRTAAATRFLGVLEDVPGDGSGDV